MTVIELETASLEEVDCHDSANSKTTTSFNLLDAIKRTSKKTAAFVGAGGGGGSDDDHPHLSSILSGEGARLTFTSITQSLSASTEEATEAFASTFSYLKSATTTTETRQDENDVLEFDDSRDDPNTEFHRGTGGGYTCDANNSSDGVGGTDNTRGSAKGHQESSTWALAVPQGYRQDDRFGSEGTTSQSELTTKYCTADDDDDNVNNRYCNSNNNSSSNTRPDMDDEDSVVSSTLHSIASESSDGTASWEDGTPTSSRDVSLLDKTESRYTTDGEETECDIDEEDTPKSNASSFQEFTEGDGLATLGGVLYQLSSCNFEEAKETISECAQEEDYSSAMNDAFAVFRQPKRTTLARSSSNMTTTPDNSPRSRNLLQTIFGCGI